MPAAVFLIDFDNVRPDAQRAPRQRDAAQAADFVRRQALTHARVELGANEAHLRYYGGWRLRRGDQSYDAGALVRWFSRVPRHDATTGIRVRCELASALLAHPALEFLGTFRPPQQQPIACAQLCGLHCAPRAQQKMVDTMLGLDLVTLTSMEPAHAILFSSDEDLFPAVLTAAHAATKAASITWLRPGRASGSSPNDPHLTSTALRVRG